MNCPALEGETMVLEAQEGEAMNLGRWLPENNRPASIMFVCSLCNGVCWCQTGANRGMRKKTCNYAYCPRCGAKMEVPNESD